MPSYLYLSVLSSFLLTFVKLHRYTPGSNAQFMWIQKALGLRRVRIQTFARMNFMYTVMSKRKLTWFVDTGRVTGWDDPRFPTIRGVSRRGIDINALKRFMCSQGASRRVVNMEWSKFWAENKKEIDKRAKRFMAIDKTEHVLLTVTNAGDGVEYLSTDYLPKDPSFGKRLVRTGKKVMLEKVDTEGMEVGENIVLTRWGRFYVCCEVAFCIRSTRQLNTSGFTFNTQQVLLNSPKLMAISRVFLSPMEMSKLPSANCLGLLMRLGTPFQLLSLNSTTLSRRRNLRKMTSSKILSTPIRRLRLRFLVMQG